jgi:hypothetical protein
MIKVVSIIGIMILTIAISFMFPPENAHVVGLFGAIISGYVFIE